MARLKKACFCLDLAVGVEILGWFGVLGGIAHMANTQTQAYPGLMTNDNESVMFELIGGVIQLVISMCLVFGARSKTKSLLLPWIILNVVLIIAVNVLVFSTVFQLSMDQGQMVFVGLLFFNLVYGHLLHIVLSLYTEIGENSGQFMYNNLNRTTLIFLEKDRQVV